MQLFVPKHTKEHTNISDMLHTKTVVTAHAPEQSIWEPLCYVAKGQTTRSLI